jgi:hypothetical protein
VAPSQRLQGHQLVYLAQLLLLVSLLMSDLSMITTPPRELPAPPSDPSDPSDPMDASTPSLDASNDARQIIRLVQCEQCSLVLRDPVTLPCGNSLCRRCIPELHPRTNISYPPWPSRLLGFQCPFAGCTMQHPEEDYSLNVVVNKILLQVRTVLEGPHEGEERCLELVHAQVVDRGGGMLHGGRLLGTYKMVEDGNLPYGSDVVYTDIGTSSDAQKVRRADAALLKRLKEATRPLMDCPVCYNVFLDPVTSTCGHTACRKCLHMVLDNSDLCPICRHRIALPLGASTRHARANAFLTTWVTGLCHNDLLAKLELARQDDLEDDDEDLYMPLFVCTIAIPHMKTFFRIFEERYCLMLRRVKENRSKQFGALLTFPNHEEQGLSVPFYEYGTLIDITDEERLPPDGQSIIEVRGASRFRVLRHSVLDGYYIGKIERFGDISIPEEEAIEAAETSLRRTETSLSRRETSSGGSEKSLIHSETCSGPKEPSTQDLSEHSPRISSEQGSNTGGGNNGDSDNGGNDTPPMRDLDSLSTQEMLDFGRNYIHMMQTLSAPWLNQSVAGAFGPCPNDAALFSWWFASVAPTTDALKYYMLLSTSARARLKICLRWIDELEARRRYIPRPSFMERRRGLLKNQANHDIL